MQTVVQKWGNSLGIRIPALYSKDLELKNGSTVEISEEEGKLVIIPKRISLNELLAKVTTENIHEAIETGFSVGNEEW
ncbi:AbrB/MazE/SpoVT family DNA-binding domain-containing protein [Gracilinema caldarium]|uniref:Transcriptional regulator/antitoxin, MazE n=1 Tax=Gracilinema caldarium (strain ATCC 51460 / DSM 7334 / H1) TaxID=744872 RepID=F8EZN9_GRAC1|nr:AbrB/MazE/SpoVT family DNA-binding domain-containing protein [Gracilinema caldarium]AEJ20763.1 transcriptional regulator/antitoxin, MazE [Gracilinema caldarium DSM 7334]